jgi:hypothetical protein
LSAIERTRSSAIIGDQAAIIGVITSVIKS